jgi:hypothetical protein
MPSCLKKNTDRTVCYPDQVIPQADRTRYERDFSRDIGTKGQRSQVVIIDSHRKVVTTFPD